MDELTEKLEAVQADSDYYEAELSIKSERLLETKRELTAVKLRAGDGWCSAQSRIDALLPREDIVIEAPVVEEPPDDPTDFSDGKVVARLVKMMRADTAPMRPEQVQLSEHYLLVAIAQIYNAWYRKAAGGGGPGEQDEPMDEQMAVLMFQWAKKIYGFNQLAQEKCRNVISVLPHMSGNKAAGLRIGLFATFLGLGPPELKSADARHLDLYLQELSRLPLGQHVIPPTHEERQHHDPAQAQEATDAKKRDGLAPRLMTFLAAAEDDHVCWIPLETALDMVKRKFRTHPKFSLTPTTLLLQRHASLNMRRRGDGVGVKKTGGMVSVDLLMDLLLKNHLDAETRVLSQEVSPYQYLTGINPNEPPPPDPLDLLDQPEDLRLTILKQAFGADFLSTMKDTLGELRKRTDPAAAWHCYSMMVQTIDAAHKSMQSMVEARMAQAAAEASDLTEVIDKQDDVHTSVQIQAGGSGAGSSRPASANRPTSARSPALPSSRPGSAGGAGGGGGSASPAFPAGLAPRAPQQPVVRVSSSSKHHTAHAPPTPRGAHAAIGDAPGSKLPALRLGGGGTSVEQSVRAGEQFLRSMISSGALPISSAFFRIPSPPHPRPHPTHTHSV